MINESENNNFRKSKFHGGFLLIERLDVIKRELDMISIPESDFNKISLRNGHSLEQLRHRWGILKDFYKEMRSKISITKDREQNDKAKRVIEKAMSDFENWTRISVMGQKSPSIYSEKISPPPILAMFEAWEDDLRDIEEKYGLNMPNKSTGEDATDA